MNSRNQSAREIFDEALRKTEPTERHAYLDYAGEGNTELRTEVESLLRAHEQAGDFLAKTIQLPETDIAIERTGTMIGRYKLLEKIGEGGFGVVYMAEQIEPLQRKIHQWREALDLVWWSPLARRPSRRLASGLSTTPMRTWTQSANSSLTEQASKVGASVGASWNACDSVKDFVVAWRMDN